MIVLTGADASGKDTQIKLLEEALQLKGKKVQILTIWDSFGDFENIGDPVLLKKVLSGFLLKFEPHARSLFLMSSLRNSLDKIKSSSEIVLVNGYIYKYWASEMAYGVERDFWKTSFLLFPQPHSIFYIRTDLKECLKRREQWTNYEKGEGRFANNISLNFFDFQEAIHKNLDKLMAELINEPMTDLRPEQAGVRIVDGNKSQDIVFQEINEKL